MVRAQEGWEGQPGKGSQSQSQMSEDDADRGTAWYKLSDTKKDEKSIHIESGQAQGVGVQEGKKEVCMEGRVALE